MALSSRKYFSNYSESRARWPQDILFPKRYFRSRVHDLPAVPAYFYHQVEPEEFSMICKKIVSAGIRTITIGDLLDGNSKDGSEVILTFDDGWSSVWSIVYPLAYRHGIRFTLFLVPQLIEDSEECRPTIDDGAKPASLIARDLGPRRMLTWGEVRAMHESGAVEIQSHSLNHGIVFSSEDLVDFSSPAGPFPLPGGAPLISRVDGKDVAEAKPPLGTPLYKWAPSLAAKKRFLADSRGRKACTDLVREGGGEDFFTTAGWKEVLVHAANRWTGGAWEDESNRRKRYRNDLLQAKRTIEERIPGARVRALSPPWAVMHLDLPEIARDTGHEIIVLGYPFPSTDSGILPLYPRLYGDAIWVILDGPIRGGVDWWQARRHAIARKATGAIP